MPGIIEPQCSSITIKLFHSLTQIFEEDKVKQYQINWNTLLERQMP